jgi:hypothetical protein
MKSGFTFTGRMVMDRFGDMEKLVRLLVEGTCESRMKLLEEFGLAFVAVTGLDPREMELVETHLHDRITFSFRKKEAK